MTFVRPAPPSAARSVWALADCDRGELHRLVAADPIVNSVVAARLGAPGSRSGLGGAMLGAFDDGALTAAVFNGGNLLPVGGTPADWTALAEQIARWPRVCTSLVGRQDAVAAFWAVLEPHWGRARAVREQQPLLVLTREDRTPVVPDPRLRMIHPEEIERYLPAAAAMFEEELGIAPLAGKGAWGFRRRVEGQLAGGRGFGIVDRSGRVVFKADLGVVTDHTCQVQGVWVRPDLRGRGLGTAALAAVFDHALRLAPSVSLYVNDFNVAARRMYANLGMRQVATLQTVLL